MTLTEEDKTNDWSILKDSGYYFLTKENCKEILSNQKIVERLKSFDFTMFMLNHDSSIVEEVNRDLLKQILEGKTE